MGANHQEVERRALNLRLLWGAPPVLKKREGCVFFGDKQKGGLAGVIIKESGAKIKNVVCNRGGGKKMVKEGGEQHNVGK